MKKIITLLLTCMMLCAGATSASASEGTARVPIIMYHQITTNSSYIGRFAIYPQEMENDLKFLKENGYTTIVMADLLNYVNNGGGLPEKPVVLTFDDGNRGEFTYLYPLLKKYGMKAVLSIIGKPTDDYSKDGVEGVVYPHLTWWQVSEMLGAGVIELQNHSYNLHGSNGSGKRKGEGREQYMSRLSKDLLQMQSRTKVMTGILPTTFTYPLGVISADSKDVLRELGFKSSLSCYEGMNTITQGNPDCLWQLKRNIRVSGTPISRVLEKMERSK